MSAVQLLVDDFYTIARIPIAVIDMKGKLLAGVGWQNICTQFHRVHPETCKNCVESDMLLSGAWLPVNSRSISARTICGTWPRPSWWAASIWEIFLRANSSLLTNSSTTTCFDLRQVKYGFNQEANLTALATVPRLDKEFVNASMAFLSKLAQVLSQSKLQQHQVGPIDDRNRPRER